MGDYELHLIDEVRAGRMSRRQLIARASVAGLSLPAVSALLAACGGGSAAGTAGSSAGRPRRGGRARIGVQVPTGDVDPVTMYDPGAIATAQMSGEYLCYPRPDFTLSPRLATSWQQGATAAEWTFTLRQGVAFHDGSPFSADDVVATFDLLTDPKNVSSALSAFQPATTHAFSILSAGQTERVDDHTVTFHLDRAYVDFPYLVSAFNYNAIILPKGYELGSFGKGGIGTGPFVLESLRPKEGATFRRNAHYWAEGLPYLDGADMRYYDEAGPLALALQAGDLDLYPQTPVAGSEQLLADPNIAVIGHSSSEYRALNLRTDKPPFDDRRVRQAFALCLDRPGLVEGLLGGRAETGDDHGFAPIFPQAAVGDAVQRRVQDYDKAKGLLEQAGLSGGVRATLTTEQYLEVPQYAEFVQQQCGKGGFQLELDVQPQSQFYDKAWLEVPLGIVDWASRGSPSQLIEPAYPCSGIWNSAHWCDQRFGQLMLQLDAETDEGRRRALAAQAAALQQEETPAVIAYWIKGVRTMRKNVHGLAPGPVESLDPSRIWLEGT
jgi:peptide/nickel transport system substrate-binding protein